MTFEQFIHKIKGSRYEHFGAVFFDVLGRRIGFTSATDGEQDRVTIRVSVLLNEAKRLRAASLMLVHNHPHDYKPKPSTMDKRVTTEIALRAKEQLGIPVIDHVIYGARDSRFSFVENGVAI